ncbi:MAG: glycosyltransferase family 4 protein [Bdellovibrionales bacterium]|nr:glycosyltransferase family 4 protein [Bdellovibrionales bacterium]
MVSPIVGEAFGQERVMRDSARLLEADGHQVFFLGERALGSPPPKTLLVNGLSTLNRFTPPAKVRQIENDVLDFAAATQPDVVHFMEQLDPRILNAVSNRYPAVLTAHTVAPTCPASGRVTATGACQAKSGWSCLVGHKSQACLSHFKNDFYRAHAIYEYQRKRLATKRLNFVLANSRYTEQLLRHDGWAASRVRFVPNPVFVPREMRRERSQHPLLVTTSRLHPLKGIGTLLDALAELKDQRWQLWICGDGPERKRLEEKSAAYALNDRVRFLGQVAYDKAGEIVAKATVLLQPNVGPETFGLSVAEASSRGIPVLTSNVPALNEIIVDGVNGFLCPPGDRSMLRERLLRVLQTPGLQRLFAENGPRLMRERFSPAAHLEATLSVYRQCTDVLADAA